jgi:glycine dehydrogenase subunit 1
MAILQANGPLKTKEGGKMRYIPNTPKDREKMLAEIGVKTIEELFAPIPEELRLKNALHLPPALSEMELAPHVEKLAKRNNFAASAPSFLGGGAYRHYIPAWIGEMISRGEFLTAYTPYQPEAAQGKLQAVYEFQTYVTMLSGMDVANASMYDGATALAEAILLANRVNKKAIAYVSSAIHPHYREVVKTYLSDAGIEMRELPFDEKTGATKYEGMTAAGSLSVGYPNYFGVVENLEDARVAADKAGAMLISVTTEALSLAILKPPGELGVDIFTGEGQSFGLPLGFGGPYLGLLAVKEKHMRQMPGKIIGRGKDIEGKDAYLIVMATREQHIRREKATSNICSNEALCAIMAAMYLTAYGKDLQKLAMLNMKRAGLLKKSLLALPRVTVPFSGTVFNEFVVTFSRDTWDKAESILGKLSVFGTLGGISLQEKYPSLGNSILVCATEQNTPQDIKEFVSLLREAVHEEK